MAALPSYVRIQLDGFSEKINPDVLVSEMERGIPKTRRLNTRSMATINATLIFTRREDTIAFDTWWDATINRAGFFDVKDPRTGTVRQMRFQKGDIGELTPMASSWGVSSRAVVLEYLR